MNKQLTFKVAKALGKDVGRGIARLDPDDIQALGLEIGDLVAIGAGRRTAARILPAHSEYRGKKLLQIDGIIRENAGVSIGDMVPVSSTTSRIAKKISLTPIGSATAQIDVTFINRSLQGMPLSKGDKVRISVLGLRNQEFVVEDTLPEGFVMLKKDTLVEVLKTKAAGIKKANQITYEDIGGMGKELSRIQEIIELPLKYPAIFQHLGVEPPKGVLLCGPPGTGKTLIARAVANEANAYFISVNGPEVIHKFYGESEAKLREIFEKAAQKSRSIIFLDEIDAIAPKRVEVTGEVEKRVVAQLLALMDGLASRGQVIVIGATNIPDSLDPALRRPGRFDREINIGVPDHKGRLEILQIHTRGMPLEEDVDLDRVAELTGGFVGADLLALCRESAMHRLRKYLPHLEPLPDGLPSDMVTSLRVSMQDFLQALEEVEPSATREFLVEVPNAGWEDVGGLDEIKQHLRETVEWPLKYADLFDQAGAQASRGIILYGPPGTGKTLLARAMANEANANFISIKGPSLLSKWVGESEKAVREVFRKARQAAPCIVFFDEIDALVSSRGMGGGAVAERVLSQLLTEMDGIEELRRVVVLGATNRLDLIDPALLRPGRFDLQLQLGLPDCASRRQILAVHTRKRPVAEDVDLDGLAAGTAGFSGADIRHLCNRASLAAVRECLAQDSSPLPAPPSIEICNRHFCLALAELRAWAKQDDPDKICSEPLKNDK
ncbi:CDC48 family AAA ATPase [Pelotomaculum propionicicum]|uniref:ATP-dependent zinc metalloprotease FtsH n=1 Tax=Pelotomaculum propionicicum TaxID=258475 RepID=A0A4Y7RMP3_9FIRM|nr:CDC48 family AAA ATPase [Pelotomaculum propionicicum]NLI13620.1 CDC48 family AAA ATPase [Peptococcaceae bacterium]TEB09942.1 ATP-dependent zinc metalloprotease FtsH [Pelotomaculum propionicicum]